MPAVIFGNRFRGRGVPAWHGIGEVFEDDPTAVEAFEDANIMYPVYRRPIFADVPGSTELVRVPNQYAIIRGESTNPDGSTVEPKFLSVVGKEFEPVQNREIAEMIDKSGLLERYQVETVGALGDGETIFTALSERDGEFEIAGTPVKSYWTMYDGKDGNRALGIMWTPVKTVCSNTLVMALKAANISIKISHGKTADKDFAFWLSLAPQLQEAQRRSREIMGHLASFQIDEDQMSEIMEAAYPRPKEIGKAQLKHLVSIDFTESQTEAIDRAVSTHERNALRQWQKISLASDVFEAYADTQGEKALAGTAWGAYEAVCDVEDHREPSRISENQFASAMFGPRSTAKRDAFKAAMKVAGVTA